MLTHWKQTITHLSTYRQINYPVLQSANTEGNFRTSKVYRQYTRNDITEPARLVIEEDMSVYQAAKSKNIPWSSLKRWIQNDDSRGDVINLHKLEKPFPLPSDHELKIVQFITEM